jgi:hypothetical protein
MSTYNDTRINLQTVKFSEKDGVSTPEMDEKSGEAVTEVVENATEKKSNEIIASYKTKGLPEPEILKIQTFQYSEISEADPAGELITLLSHYNQDAEQVLKVAASIINRGLVLAQQNFGREFMKDSDQASVEGVYDLMTDASKPGEGRRKADPASKAVKALSELLGQSITADDLAALLASFKANNAV